MGYSCSVFLFFFCFSTFTVKVSVALPSQITEDVKIHLISTEATGSTVFFAPCVVLTSKVAVVRWYHQQLSLGVLDNVTPMDGVCMAQEFVLVNIDTPI